MNAQTNIHGPAASLIHRIITLFEKIPNSLIALMGRFGIAAVFWQSAQTKVEGFAIDLLAGTVQLGIPRLADSTIPLFQTEYNLPLISPELAAYVAALSEHLFALLLLVGLATRFSALALLGMTLVIEIFVYPGAYPIHATWAAVMLLLIARGPGVFSIDHLLAKRFS
jgi:putative oxidoreductase